MTFSSHYYKKILPVFLIITVTACGGNNEKETTSKTKERATISQAKADTTAPANKLNMNTASGKEFKTVPNVGEKMEHEFKEYRPYVSIQQFRKEIGKYVDESQVAAYEKYIYVPIHRNDSDAATLMQIPGLNENEAQELVDGRPYKSNQTFLDALGSSINDDELTTAKTYLKSE